MSYQAKRPFTSAPSDVIGVVTFTNATYRNKPVEGTFALVKGYQEGGNGEGFVTIREPGGKRSRVTVFKNKGYTIDLKETSAAPKKTRSSGAAKASSRQKKPAVKKAA